MSADIRQKQTKSARHQNRSRRYYNNKVVWSWCLGRAL